LEEETGEIDKKAVKRGVSRLKNILQKTLIACNFPGRTLYA